MVVVVVGDDDELFLVVEANLRNLICEFLLVKFGGSLSLPHDDGFVLARGDDGPPVRRHLGNNDIAIMSFEDGLLLAFQTPQP